MLIRYKKNYEKMAMGLLSFMPSEKDLKVLQNTIKLYETDESWQLFLYKENEDIIGAIGIRLDNETAQLHHLSINPSFRGKGKGRVLLDELKHQLGPSITIIPTEDTLDFFEKCN